MNKNQIVQDWYLKYYKKLYIYLNKRLSDKHSIEDIIQNTFISAWKNFDKYQENKKFDCWLVTILKRRLVDHHRKKQIKNIDIDDFVLSYKDPEIQEFSYKIQKSLSEINKDLAHAFLLINIHEYSYKEAAKKLNVPIGTILSRACRAKNQLRKKLINNEL